LTLKGEPMAHHNFDHRDAIREQLLGLNLGATGQYPEGRYGPHDEGEIKFAVAADAPNQKVLIEFGKPVRSLGMNAEQAQGLINMLQAKLWELRGII
jgi:hypothetical protein